jgi:Protein of unknown function (DUF3237)
MSDIAFRPLFTMEVETTPQIVGDVPMGYFRRTGMIVSGRFHGPKLNGKVLPGGGDWLIKRRDGVIHLDVRAILETDEGHAIYMTYTGRLKSSPAIDERMARGETIPASDLYFRTLVQFETAAESLLWMNDIVAVGIGSRRPNGPVYSIYEIL